MLFKNGLIITLLLLNSSDVLSKTNISDPSSVFSLESQYSVSHKVELGRYLFHDVRLSKKGNRSCALCHNPDEGWTNTFSKVPDINGEPTSINTPSILNSAANPIKSISNAFFTSLESAISTPLLSIHPLEMGMDEKLITQRLEQAKDLYSLLFINAFGTDDMAFDKVVSALAAFVTSIQSIDTNYHRYIAGENVPFSDDAIKGIALFQSEKFNCSACHSGIYLNTTKVINNVEFYNTGMYGIRNEEGLHLYPSEANGLRKHTRKIEDDGKYRTPSLINVLNTGPWGHDGSFTQLEDVLDHYSQGGREIVEGKNTGKGKLSEAKDIRLQGFSLSSEEKRYFMAFFAQLTINNQAQLAKITQSPFCQLIKLRNKQDPDNCIPPFKGN